MKDITKIFIACVVIMAIMFVLFLLTIIKRKKISPNSFGIVILLEVFAFGFSAMFSLCLGFFMR